MSSPFAWSSPETVAGFVNSPPNQTLMAFAALERAAGRGDRVVDIGCGAGRNALPLAWAGASVIGLDMSRPMLEAAVQRARAQPADVLFAQAPMDALPVRTASADLVIAHGIWNLAGSGEEFRHAVSEAARIAADGASLFVFTFSRHTLPPEARAVEGERFVYTQFSGEPQVFLTRDELVAELAAAGFTLDEAVVPLREHNLPKPGMLRAGGPPVIYEAVFRRNAR
jgi:ubiquinone/menaquinone biosynthesis C-methylase UbiE